MQNFEKLRAKMDARKNNTLSARRDAEALLSLLSEIIPDALSTRRTDSTFLVKVLRWDGMHSFLISYYCALAVRDGRVVPVKVEFARDGYWTPAVDDPLDVALDDDSVKYFGIVGFSRAIAELLDILDDVSDGSGSASALSRARKALAHVVEYAL